MTVYSLFVLNKHAGMIYTKDFNVLKNETEKVFTYPLDVKLDDYGQVKFGGRDGIKNGHVLITLNGQPVYKDRISNKLKTDNIEDVFEFFKNADNYPVQLRFGKTVLSTNDKIVLTGRFFG